MSITVGPKPAAPAPRAKKAFHPLDAIKLLASLKLTVWLFVLSFLLVFFGTLAQIDYGVWTVVRGYFRSFVVFVPFNLLLQFGQIFFGLPAKTEAGAPIRVGGSFPFPGGWTLAILLMINLVAAHAVRFTPKGRKGVLGAMARTAAVLLVLDAVLGLYALFVGYTPAPNDWLPGAVLLGNVVALLAAWFGKRSGILVLHAGLMVMLAGEIMTGLYAVEGNMVIEEGETTNLVTDSRVCELAVTDPSDAKADTVTTVPRWMLRQTGRTVSHDDLPFDVVPLEYMVNSALENAGKDNPATAGEGLRAQALKRAEGSGVATEQTTDVPSLYARLIDKATGRDLGTYLFTAWLTEPEEVTVGGKKYEVALRFKQTRRPFEVTLLKFSFDRYPGTRTALNYSSLVHLSDPERGDDRDVLIRMNVPLRHAGEAFYQSSFNSKTEKGTVLQVVRNPAWTLPYWSCGIVTLGMLMHFGVSLVEFLKRRGA